MRKYLFDTSLNRVWKDALWIIDNVAPDKATAKVSLNLTLDSENSSYDELRTV